MPPTTPWSPDKEYDVRWKQRFQNFSRSLQSLRSGRRMLGADSDNDLMQSGLIQRFEVAFELAWKTLKDFLTAEGFRHVDSPKGAIRQAFQSGYIHHGDTWMQALESQQDIWEMEDISKTPTITDAILKKYLPLLEELEIELNKRRSR